MEKERQKKSSSLWLEEIVGITGVGSEMVEPTEDMVEYYIHHNGKTIYLGIEAHTVGPYGLADGIFNLTTDSVDEIEELEEFFINKFISQGLPRPLAKNLVHSFDRVYRVLKKSGKVKTLYRE